MSNICFLIYDFTKNGGAERASAKLANELVVNHNVTIISVFNEYSTWAYELNESIHVIKIFDSAGHIIKNIGMITKKIRAVVREYKIDYLLSIDIATALMGALGTKLTGTKLIVCDRSSCFNEDMYSSFILRFYAWVGIHASNVYQVMTEDGRNGCIEKYMIRKEKIVVIPNWIDEKAIRDDRYNYDNKKIITVGRAALEKNYEELIRIAKKIKPFCKGWEWHIWGNFESDYGKELLKKIEEENLGDFLIHKGVTKNIYEVYPNYSFFVMTSRFEGMPNVLLEAHGSKLPTLAYNCKTGPSELISDGENGYLVELNNTEEMCEKILELVKNRDKAECMSQKTSMNYEKYSKENILIKWNDILR